MDWLNAVLQGVLLGGLYALFAAGLSLVFGVMRLVNIAHGDFIILAAFLAFAVVDLSGFHPIVALLAVVPLMALLGYVLQRVVFNKTLGGDLLAPLLVTFGLSVIIQNALLEIFSADSRRLPTHGLEAIAIELGGGLSLGLLPVIMFAAALAILGGLHGLFYGTTLGRMFRATSDNQDIAQLMGVDIRRTFALATAIAFAVIAVGGVFLGMRTNFDPSIGPARLIFAFEAVIIGGVGNIWGTLLGGIVLGVAQAVGAQIDSSIQILSGHIAFLVFLIVRPQGLLPKVNI